MKLRKVFLAQNNCQESLGHEHPRSIDKPQTAPGGLKCLAPTTSYTSELEQQPEQEKMRLRRM